MNDRLKTIVYDRIKESQSVPSLESSVKSNPGTAEAISESFNDSVGLGGVWDSISSGAESAVDTAGWVAEGIGGGIGDFFEDIGLMKESSSLTQRQKQLQNAFLKGFQKQSQIGGSVGDIFGKDVNLDSLDELEDPYENSQEDQSDDVDFDDDFMEDDL